MPQSRTACQGSEPLVFVSYSHLDAVAVQAAILRLQDDGFDVWYDSTGIGAGNEWNDEIAQAIKNAAAFVYFITPRSVATEHCRRELNFAQSEGRPVVAVHLEPTDVPDGLRLSLDNRQAILAHEHPDTWLRELALALGGGVEPAVAPPASSPAPDSGSSRVWMALVAVAGVAALAVGGWWFGGRSAAPAAPEDALSSIAVLPFRDASPGQDKQWLATGLSTQLRRRLAQNPGLRVVPLAAINEFAATGSNWSHMAEQLSVSVLLEGTVQASGDTVRVAVDMIDPLRRQTVWSQEFTGTADDPIALQESVLLQIARFLNHQLEPGSFAQPRGRAAQIAWYRYLGYGWAGNTPAKQRWLEEVLRIDPEFAYAYLDVFWVYVQMARAYADSGWLVKARGAIDRAAELGLGDHPAWHLAKSTLLWQFEADLDRGEHHTRQALAGGIGVQQGQFMLLSGLVAEARAFAELQVGQRPYSPPDWTVLAVIRAYEGDLAGAHEAAMQISRLLPADAWQANFMLNVTLPGLGRLDEADRLLARLRELLPREQYFPDLELYVWTLEYGIAVARGDRAAAIAAVESIAEAGWYAPAGVLYVALEDDRATAALDTAATPPFLRINYLGAYLVLLPVEKRNDPRLRRMLDAMGFTLEWRLEYCRRIAAYPPELGPRCDPRRHEPDVARQLPDADSVPDVAAVAGIPAVR